MIHASSLERLAFLAIVVGLIALLLGGFYCVTVASGRRRRAIARRPITAVHEWCRTHYGDFSEQEWEHVKAVLHIFADEIGVNPGQLEPSDSLLHQYCLKGTASYFDDTWDVWTEKLSQYLETMRGSSMSRQECDRCPPCVTLDDVIRATVALLRQQEVSGRSGSDTAEGVHHSGINAEAASDEAGKQ